MKKMHSFFFFVNFVPMAFFHGLHLGNAARLLHFFGLWQLRHRPLFALSTGEGRKLLMVDALLKEPASYWKRQVFAK